MPVFSAPINITRYTNGTLVKLTASAHEFTSYDYDPMTGSGTFMPSQIVLRAQLEGDITLGGWRYSTDGLRWYDVETGQGGMVIDGATLTLFPTSDVFGATNSMITFMAVSTDGGYYDTLTIVRTIDPAVVYRNLYTEIQQDRNKIALIASDQQLQQFSESSTMVDKMAQIEVKADSITSTVETSYATKTYAQQQADAAESAAISTAAADATAKANAAQSAAAADATTKANAALATARSEIQQTATEINQTVSTKVGETEVQSMINQSARSIRLQATEISWDSDNSSMTSDGVLTCNGANINGKFSSVTEGVSTGDKNKVVSENGCLNLYQGNDEDGWELIGQLVVSDQGFDIKAMSSNSNMSWLGLMSAYGNILLSPADGGEVYTNADTVRINADEIKVHDGKDSVAVYTGFSGSVTIDGITLQFVNGICV